MGHLPRHKILLNCCNILFLFCGICLITSGFYLFTDAKRLLLSRLLAATSDQISDLPQPLLYYISLGIAMAGSVAIIAAMIGFWASCLNNYCCLSLYFLAIVILLLIESIACLAITLWPHCLGITLNTTKMVKALQSNYGLPGREQFTIAMDLAQTRFECCGMNSDNDYDLSLWRLQSYGQRDWTVPLTCCVLTNVAATQHAYLDPKPSNETQCQALQRHDYERHRHPEACLRHLEYWYREQYIVFLAASLAMAIIEFCVLLSIVLSCTKIAAATTTDRRGGRDDDDGATKKKNAVQRHQRNRARSRQILVQNIYEPEVELHAATVATAAGSDDYSDDLKEIYVQPPELHKQRHNTTFKPSSNAYQVPGSYLV